MAALIRGGRTQLVNRYDGVSVQDYDQPVSEQQIDVRLGVNTELPVYSGLDSSGIRKRAEQALEVARQNPDPRNFLDSVMLFTQAIKMNPGEEWAHYGRGLCQIFLKNPEAAIADFSAEIELNKSPASQGRARFERGLTYMRSEKWNDALKDYGYLTEKADLYPDLIEEADRAIKNAEERIAQEEKKIADEKEKKSQAKLRKANSIFTQGRQNLNIFEGRKQYFEALKMVNEEIDEELTNEKIWLRALINHQAGWVAEARKDYKYLMENAADDYPKSTNLYRSASLQYYATQTPSALIGLIIVGFGAAVGMRAGELHDLNHQAEFRPEEEAKNAIKGFARGFIEFHLRPENLPQEDLTALLKLNEDQARQLFEEALKKKSPEELQAFLAKELSLIPDSAHLKSLIAEPFTEIIGSTLTQDIDDGPKNFVYDRALPQGITHNPLKAAKLEEFLGIFKDEALRYM